MGSLVFTLIACSIGAAPGDDVKAKFEEHTFKFTGGEYQDEAFRYRLLKPEHIEPGKKYPVVLFLHGAGERGDDNASQLQYLPELMATTEYREKFLPCFLIAPQCRVNKLWVVRGADKSGVSEQMQVAEGILQHVETEVSDRPGAKSARPGLSDEAGSAKLEPGHAGARIGSPRSCRFAEGAIRRKPLALCGCADPGPFMKRPMTNVVKPGAQPPHDRGDS